MALRALPSGHRPLERGAIAREGGERLLANLGRDAELLQRIAKRPPPYPARLSRQLAEIQRPNPSGARGKLTRFVATGLRAYGAAFRATNARLETSRARCCSTRRKVRLRSAGTRESDR